jgi:hypothetical protein
MEFVKIPRGSFMMGCSPGDAECYAEVRVSRGGSWRGIGRGLTRVSSRYSLKPSVRSIVVGFRVKAGCSPCKRPTPRSASATCGAARSPACGPKSRQAACSAACQWPWAHWHRMAVLRLFGSQEVKSNFCNANVLPWHGAQFFWQEL